MRLFVDIENKKLVQSLNSDRISSSPNFMQGDNEPLEIHLLSSGTSSLYEDKILNPKHDFLRVGIARFKGEPKLLSITSGYTPLENGGCIITLPLNTIEIEKALGNNASLDAFLEIEYSTPEGRIVTILQTNCKVKNDLIEDVPSIEIREQFYTKAEADKKFVAESNAIKPAQIAELIVYANLPKYTDWEASPKIQDRLFDLQYFELPVSIFIDITTFKNDIRIYSGSGSSHFSITIRDDFLTLYVGGSNNINKSVFSFAGKLTPKGGKIVISIGDTSGNIEVWIDAMPLGKTSFATQLNSTSFVSSGLSLSASESVIKRLIFAHQKTEFENSHFSVLDFQNSKLYPCGIVAESARNSKLGADILDGWSLENSSTGGVRGSWYVEYPNYGEGKIFCKNSNALPVGINYGIDLGFSYFDHSNNWEFYGGFYPRLTAYGANNYGLGYGGYKVKIKTKIKYLQLGKIIWGAGQRYIRHIQEITQEDIAKGWHDEEFEFIDNSDPGDISYIFSITPMAIDGAIGAVISLADFSYDVEGMYFEYSDESLVNTMQIISPLGILGLFYNSYQYGSADTKKIFSKHAYLYWSAQDRASIDLSLKFQNVNMPTSSSIVELWILASNSLNQTNTFDIGTSDNPKCYGNSITLTSAQKTYQKVAEFCVASPANILIKPTTILGTSIQISYILIGK